MSFVDFDRQESGVIIAGFEFTADVNVWDRPSDRLPDRRRRPEGRAICSRGMDSQKGRRTKGETELLFEALGKTVCGVMNQFSY